jgi:hypothetical protein
MRAEKQRRQRQPDREQRAEGRKQPTGLLSGPFLSFLKRECFFCTACRLLPLFLHAHLINLTLSFPHMLL